MIDYKKYILELKKYGFDSNKENLSDFWFSNKVKISPKLFGSSGNDNLFSLLVRWESPLGRACSTEIREFIDLKQRENIQLRNSLYKEGKYSFIYAIIDFFAFSFTFNNELYTLSKFNESFPTSQISGLADLRGIDLNGININDSILKNAFFALSNFSNCKLQQLHFENMNFVSANFKNAILTSIILDESSTFSNATFDNAFLNNIDLTDKILSGGISIKEISYFELLKKALTIEVQYDKRNHTEFLFVNTKEISSYDLLSFKKNIEWYMTISRKISDSKKDWKKRISIIFQILISKYWTSYSVFGSITFLTILVLAYIFYFTSSNFKIPTELSPIDFFDSIYFVVVTFTTLGYGDISPTNWAGQLFVIITALTGYLFLGIFIYLLSKKIGSD